MKYKGRIEQYLDRFLQQAVWGAVEVFPQVVDVKLLQMFPASREIWCVFVYHPEIQEIESKLDMWARFWEARARAAYSCGGVKAANISS